MIHNCAACNAPITLKSNRTAYVTCPYCAAVNRRLGNDLTSITGVDIANNFSILKRGQKIVIEGLTLELIGRIVVDCEDGAWNEWFCIDEKGDSFWFSEAMGYYYLLTEEAIHKYREYYNSLKMSDDIKHNGKTYYLTNRDEVSCIGVEGELPISVYLTQRWTSLDFKSHDRSVLFVNIDLELCLVYAGKIYEYDDFKIIENE